jgi:hypothetical protein
VCVASLFIIHLRLAPLPAIPAVTEIDAALKAKIALQAVWGQVSVVDLTQRTLPICPTGDAGQQHPLSNREVRRG